MNAEEIAKEWLNDCREDTPFYLISAALLATRNRLEKFDRVVELLKSYELQLRHLPMLDDLWVAVREYEEMK